MKLHGMHNPMIIGRCGYCGGQVATPAVWWGTSPPPIRCLQCGSVPRDDEPVIDMVPARRPERQGGAS